MRSGPLSQLPINPRQHAYQAGKSTDSALHQLVGRIEKALDAKEYSLGVFFDIEGAFDNTSTKSVRIALNEWKANRMVSTRICACSINASSKQLWVTLLLLFTPSVAYLKVEDFLHSCGHSSK